MTKPSSRNPSSSSRPSDEPERDESGKFIPGTTGNPKGRPRKKRDGPDLYAVLMAPVPLRQPDGRVRKVPYPEAHVMKLQERTLRGDAQASKELTNLLARYGFFDKAVQARDYAAEEHAAQEKMIAITEEAIRRSKGKTSG